MRLRRYAPFILAFALLGGSSALAAAAPKVRIATVDQLAKPLPYPYDEKADANRQVDAARARAKASGKLLMIEMGGNWCPDCRILAGIMKLPEMNAFIRSHYEVVTVDIGRMDKNQQIPGRYGIAKLAGVPAILVVDPKKDQALNADHVFALADARSMAPQALADWLAQWTR
jgi:thiol-disulfide isomerase/thioredoxin